MKSDLSSLTYAVSLTVIGKYTGQLLLLLAILSLAPMGVALLLGDMHIATRYLQIVVLLLLVSVPLSRLQAPARIQSNEALVITAFAFLFSPVLMSYPMMASGLSYGDALFESVSAITTTGLSTVTELQSRPASFLFARA